jgi:hypothetical protein
MTKIKEGKSDVEYRLARVIVRAFHEQLPDADTDQAESVSYNMGMAASLSEETSSIQIGIRLKASLDQEKTSEDDPLDLAELEIALVFRIRHLDSVRDETGAIKVPRDVMAMMTGIALSTARGVLIGKSTRPEVSSYPLPVITPTHFLGSWADETSPEWLAGEGSKE